MGAVLEDPIARLFYFVLKALPESTVEDIMEDIMEDIEKNDGLLCQDNRVAQMAEDYELRLKKVYMGILDSMILELPIKVPESDHNANMQMLLGLPIHGEEKSDVIKDHMDIVGEHIARNTAEQVDKEFVEEIEKRMKDE